MCKYIYILFLYMYTYICYVYVYLAKTIDNVHIHNAIGCVTEEV